MIIVPNGHNYHNMHNVNKYQGHLKLDYNKTTDQINYHVLK